RTKESDMDAPTVGDGREVACHVCDDRSFRVFSRRGRNRIVVCRECGLFYANPLPVPDFRREEVADSAKYTLDQVAKRAFFRRRADDLLDRLESLRRPGRLLDVGC